MRKDNYYLDSTFIQHTGSSRHMWAPPGAATGAWQSWPEKWEGKYKSVSAGNRKQDKDLSK